VGASSTGRPAVANEGADVRMSERTERSEGHERMPRRQSMSERTERSEGHERMPGGRA
jgi:hypothetical protein